MLQCEISHTNNPFHVMDTIRIFDETTITVATAIEDLGYTNVSVNFDYARTSGSVWKITAKKGAYTHNLIATILRTKRNNDIAPSV